MLTLRVTERLNVPNDTSIADFILKDPPPGWTDVFRWATPEITLVSRIIDQLGDFYPLKQDLFKAFDLCPLDQVKVVIIGQDPYHSTHGNLPQANGLAFSTNKGCPIQPPLNNIYKELKQEYPDYIFPKHGDLTKWVEQGVLLLNTCLTVRPGQPGSHKEIWNGFLSKVLDSISEANPECIFLLWGKKSHDLTTKLSQRAIKLYASHPSPYSANKGSRDAPAFIGCGHFKEVNMYLEKHKKTPIDWQIE